MRALRFAIALGVVLAGSSVNAYAQTTSADAAMAQSLFDEGRRLMAAQKFAEACPKLAESQRLDPALGTLLNLAVCHERSGRTATAWSELHDAMSIAKREGRADRVKYARDRIDAIEPHLSRLTITRAAGGPSSLEVRIDDAVFGEAALGTAVTIDPGVHRIEARAAGKKAWKTEVTIGADADRKAIEIPVLQDAPVADGPPNDALPPDDASHAGASSMRVDPQSAHASASTRRTIGYTVGAVGLVAIGVGVVAGLEAANKWNVRRDNCPSDACNAVGLDADKSARRWATIADIGIGAGIAGVAVGTILVLTGHAKSTVAAASVSRFQIVPIVGADRAELGASLRW